MANTTDSLTSMPNRLRRTAAYDRAEAERVARRSARESGLPGYDDARDTISFDEALSAIQLREADAVYMASPPLARDDATWSILSDLAYDASETAYKACREATMTLAQRATLLDCARSLVRLAIEVAS